VDEELADLSGSELPKLDAAGVPLRFGLALSGGGLRATLFHLGVVRLLYETRLLPRVKFISGVSGGTILAMHLGLHWDRYCGNQDEFESVAKEILDFCQIDMRNRILRRWLFGWATIFPRLLLGWSRVRLLVATYERLFRNTTLNDLRLPAKIPRPRIIAQSVSLSTGAPCGFGRSGFMWYEPDDNDFLHEREIAKKTPHLPIALAVAASSAFPPMFPPVRITARMLHVGVNEFPNPQYLTDGGVYDNLGIERPLWYFEQKKELDAFIISNAGGMFEWGLGTYLLSLPRNVRATDILMKRVGDLIYQRLDDRQQHEFVRLSIGDTTDSLAERTLPPAVQRRVGRIRTDLDAFNKIEIDSLIRHGHAVARKELVARGWIAAATPHCDWFPVGPTQAGANEWAESLQKSSRRSAMKLFSMVDWPIWAAAVVAILVGLAAWLLLTWRA
jgi:predicted acylesterase/phospholipase RssA